MSLVTAEVRTWVTVLGDSGYRGLSALGDLAIFSGRTLGWLVRRRPTRGTLLASCYMVGVRSVPVVSITGIFIGMVLAVQAYSQFHHLGLDSQLGAIVNVSVIRELGPVLAATMIAGRVGSAMAAELGTMTVTDQVDALRCLGVPPVHYLVVPRFLACVLLIPLLTVLADFTGIFGGVVISTKVYHVEPYFYWARAREAVHLWDVSSGLLKSLVFGAAIALISCYQGFQCRAGAEGVGRAATRAFVLSFIAILAIDFFMGVFLNDLSDRLWPESHATF